MTEEWLQQNALWIIMDPWYPHPDGTPAFIRNRKDCPNIDELNNNILLKVADYLPKLQHFKISTKTFTKCEKRIKISIHWKLSHIQNFLNRPAYSIAYMKKNNLHNIVYCGLHYGRCILRQPDGAINMSRLYKTWVKKDLCGFFLDHKLQSMKEADKLTKQYATII